MPNLIVNQINILACTSGEQNKTVAENLVVSVMMVGKWRRRYPARGVAGLHDELRPGRPHTYDNDKIAKVINLLLQTKSDDGCTHWRTRTVAVETGVSKSVTVHGGRALQALDALDSASTTALISERDRPRWIILLLAFQIVTGRRHRQRSEPW